MKRGREGVSGPLLRKISNVVLGVGMAITVVVIIATVLIAAYSKFITTPWDKDNQLNGSEVVVVGTVIVIALFSLTLITFGGLRFAERSVNRRAADLDYDEVLAHDDDFDL